MISKYMSGQVVGGALLVAGTSIGAGMLALPVVTASGGFFPACFVYLLCWLFMTATGLLLLELCLQLPPDANLVTMAATYLGRPGKFFAWILYLFLFYCLSTAYICGGGSLLRDWLGMTIPWTSQILFVAVLGLIVYAGARMVDRLNLFLMGGLIATYFTFVFLGFPSVNMDRLSHASWDHAWIALPVIFTSFSYQGIIPTLTSYLKRDPGKLRFAIIAGTTLTFLIYLLWEFLILGIVPVEGEAGLQVAKELGLTAVAPLKTHVGSSSIPLIGQAFAFFAITTSFIGVTLGLLDFLADGLRVSKKGIRRVVLALLTFGPPTVIALVNPNIFIGALTFAGGIGCALLLGLLPTLMVWTARYRKGSEHFVPPQLGGGKGTLVFLFLFVFLELVMELWQEVS